MADQIEASEIFADGDQASGTILGENNDPGSVAVHVQLTNGDGSPDGVPYASVYLSPIDAALFGAQVIAAARAAMPEVPNA